MRELSATEIAEVTTLYEFCCSDIRAERIDAGRRLGEWLMVKRDQDVDLKSLTYVLDVDIDAIYGWIALVFITSISEIRLRASISVGGALRRRLPGLPEEVRNSSVGGLIKESAAISEPRYIVAADSTERIVVYEHPAELQESRAAAPERTAVLVMTGSDRNGNRFGSEISMIRRLTDFSRKSYIERNCVSADEIGHQLRENPATIIHLAFHAAYGAAEFEGPEGDSDPAQVRFDDLVATLKQEAPPSLLVLAGCDSIRVASGLGDWAATTVAWPSKTYDHEIRRYCHGLYLSLFRGEGMERAHGAGMNNISVVDEDLRPQCLGNKNWALAHGPP